jgi:hypothetical protein
MGIPNDTVAEHELDDKRKGDREEAQKRRLERSLEQGARGQLSGFRPDQCHAAAQVGGRQEDRDSRSKIGQLRKAVNP